MSFNGAGDHSPDVTEAGRIGTVPVEPLQWGRGSLPGCNHKLSTDAPDGARGFNGAGDHSPDVTWNGGILDEYANMLQWGRGSLPGCNHTRRLAAHALGAASMGPGITPRM